ncbi:Phosphatidylinositol transfer protein 3 [Chlorella vulgaris]
MPPAIQTSASRCTAAFRTAGARGPRRAAAVCAAASQPQQPGLDRRQALLGLAVVLVGTKVQPALADEGSTPGTEIFYGQASPPTSYGGYGGNTQNAKADAKYIFEYPTGWKSETVNKRDKGTQGVDCRVFNPRNKLQQVFVITLGRAGEDNRSFRLTNVDATLEGFAGADYDMLDALGGAILRKDETREIDGQLYYDIEFASPDNHYLASITVNAGKVYAMFIKSPERIFPEAEASLRAIRESFHTIDQVAMAWFEAVKLSSDEESKLIKLKEAVASTAAGSAAHAAFLTRGTYIRYLRARSWKVDKAAKMLLETLKWRGEYKPQELKWDNIKHEGARGKLFILEHADKAGRPVVIMRPRLEAVYSGNGDERVKWLVYTLEQAARLADEWSPDGKMTWLIDFVGYNSKNSPPFKISLQVLSILQNHFPERLGCAVSYKPPMLFNILWRAVSPFVDPNTRDKLVFLSPSTSPEELEKHFDPQHIDDSLGGAIPIEQLWSFEGYGQRMQELDAQAAASLQAAQAAVAAGAKQGKPSADEVALTADFEQHVTVI